MNLTRLQFASFQTILLMVAIVAAACVAGSSCGYRMRSASKNFADGIRSLGIPTFVNHTQRQKIEQQMTRALLREFTVRTGIPVSSASAGVDAVLQGEVRNLTSSPVAFGTDTFGSAFIVVVQMSVKLVRTRDGAVLWEDSDFVYRERYILNTKVTDFFSEEGPALQRLSREFAASLVSAMLNR